jgi:hypothetical protein
MITRTYASAGTDVTKRRSPAPRDPGARLRLDRDSIVRNTLRNPWVWLIAACLVLFATRADASFAAERACAAWWETGVAWRCDRGAVACVTGAAKRVVGRVRHEGAMPQGIEIDRWRG